VDDSSTFAPLFANSKQMDLLASPVPVSAKKRVRTQSKIGYANSQAKKQKQKEDAAALPGVLAQLEAQRLLVQQLQARHAQIDDEAATNLARCRDTAKASSAHHLATAAKVAADMADRDTQITTLQSHALTTARHETHHKHTKQLAERKAAHEKTTAELTAAKKAQATQQTDCSKLKRSYDDLFDSTRKQHEADVARIGTQR
jgi:hypothetical protein